MRATFGGRWGSIKRANRNAQEENIFRVLPRRWRDAARILVITEVGLWNPLGIACTRRMAVRLSVQPICSDPLPAGTLFIYPLSLPCLR